ncbi:MAG: hypothetical protein Q9208_008701 [Pyrenodesmia sp. 3 TL-2023]
MSAAIKYGLRLEDQYGGNPDATPGQDGSGMCLKCPTYIIALAHQPLIDAKCISIMKEATRIVHRTEPGTLRYHLHVEMKNDQRGESIVFLEE